MYVPAHFAENRPEVMQQLMREHPFGLLVTQDAGGIVGNSVPFVYDAGEGSGTGILRTHVARANPVWREARGDVDALVVFEGAQAYVSPAWYPSKAEHGKAVPTWNYVMVQARGRLRAIEDEAWLRAFVTRLTDMHESARVQDAGSTRSMGPTGSTAATAATPAPAPAWAVTDAPPDFVDSMLRAIVGIEIEVTALVGKWKVSQNRSAADRDGVVRGLAGVSGSEAAAMAALVGTPRGTA